MLGKHLSMPWRIAFLSLDQLPRFYSVHLQCCEISVRVQHEICCQCHLPWDILIFFFFFWSQALPSFMSINSAWLSFPGYTEFQMVATSAFPEWEISSITAFYIQSKFFFQHYRLSFFSLSLFWTASLWAQFPLLTTHFWKMSCGFITWKQGGTISIRFAVCVWTEYQMCLSKKCDDYSQIRMYDCYLHSDLWPEKMAAEFVLVPSFS